MINGKRVLGLIPARAGSVRIPDKNIQEVGGIALVSWAVLAAKESEYIDTVAVSTDSGWIASESFKFGANLVVKRPVGLSGPWTPSVDVVAHALLHSPADYVVLLQPTSPARRGALIDRCLFTCQNLGGQPVCTVSDKTHEQNGLVYVLSARDIESDCFELFKNYPCEVPHEMGVDIDEWVELIEAERLYIKRNEWFPEVLDKAVLK